MKKRGVGLLSSLLLFAILDFLLGILIPDEVLNVVFAVTMTVVFVGLVSVVYGTFTRNRWGVNFKEVNCPGCHALVPKVRKPKSRYQMLWGGWTCDKCGCEMDKWGNVIATSASG
jgi:hypothetical protein